MFKCFRDENVLITLSWCTYYLKFNESMLVTEEDINLYGDVIFYFIYVLLSLI